MRAKAAREAWQVGKSGGWKQ
jgi:hypothetical protein